jgi:hypothetical protein
MRGAAIVAASAVLGLLPTLAQAQDLGTSRRVQGTAAVTTVEVGDVPGHVVGVVEFKGLSFFEGGEIATHTNPATFDLTNGSGPHQGYVTHYFDDGSTSIERYRGEARLSADGKRTVVEGTFECIGGTGRFAGLEGEGTYRGERLGALRSGDYVYVDTTGSCTVP